MRRWIAPLLAGIIVALVAFQLTLVATPRFLMAAAVRRVGAAGMNRMFHGPLPSDKARQIVRPSPDLAYSSCPFDVSHGAIRVHVGPVPSAYWSLSIFDSNTDVAFVRNNLDSHGAGIDVVLLQPLDLWEAPPGDKAQIVYVKQPRGIALVRILVDDRSRFPTIDQARRASTCGRL
jgi:uncharacterized membrane protein